MLRPEELQVDIGRCAGGSFVRITHIPTAIFRLKGPFHGESPYVIKERFLAEIEQELIARGLSQYVVPAYRKKYGEI